MKKTFVLFFAILLCFIISSCGREKPDTPKHDINSIDNEYSKDNDVDYLIKKAEFTNKRYYLDDSGDFYSSDSKSSVRYDYYTGYEIEGLLRKELKTYDENNKLISVFTYSEPKTVNIELWGEPDHYVEGYVQMYICYSYYLNNDIDMVFENISSVGVRKSFFVNGIEFVQEEKQYELKCSENAFEFWYENDFINSVSENIDSIAECISAYDIRYIDRSFYGLNQSKPIPIEYDIDIEEGEDFNFYGDHNWETYYDSEEKLLAVYCTHSQVDEAEHIILYKYDNKGRVIEKEECFYNVNIEPRSLVMEILGGNTSFEKETVSIVKYYY
ncbi:MAG: hypothetical protein IJZ58_01555 [Oscillospiraceae bacterium]|nr:hypothetical protein [Oscillospiraceae bacterium]